MLEGVRKIHFIGISGIGMSGIAKVLLGLNYQVSGSDLNTNSRTEKLKEAGAIIYKGHSAENITDDVDLVVVSSAVPENNVEVLAAKERKITIWHRAKMLGKLMDERMGITIAGAHGKTTTTSMVSFILEKNGMDPTIVIGGELEDIGGNAKLGYGDYLVAEADESDGSLVNLHPYYAIVTNIEADHLDYYGGLDKIVETFRIFLNNIHENGTAILCIDNINIREMLPSLKCNYLTYSIKDKADIMAHNIVLFEHGGEFDVIFKGEKAGHFAISIPGIHNVSNALAVIGLGLEIGLTYEQIRDALVQFRGVQRRFQLLGEVNGVKVVDDYAHHPTEIKATLKAAKQGAHKRVICVFQPHRYSRTKFLKDEFSKAFSDADVIILMDIYPAGEAPIPGVNAQLLVQGIKEYENRPVQFFYNHEDVVEYLLKLVKPEDLVLVMGAGNVWMVGEKLVQRMQEITGVI